VHKATEKTSTARAVLLISAVANNLSPGVHTRSLADKSPACLRESRCINDALLLCKNPQIPFDFGVLHDQFSNAVARIRANY
jgi:hypothetical protein